MPQDLYNIKGLPRPSDAKSKTDKIPYVPNLPLRYEVSELASSPKPGLRKQWTLFVLGLEKFKGKPVDAKLSYFQVAGIHSYPEQPWDGAPAPQKGPKIPDHEEPGEQPFGGYCNHNGLNFPTWHRPYMLLFERCIWENMHEVITHWVTEHGLTDDTAQEWKDAADAWRLPYWDWAAKQTYTEDFACPEILVQGPVRIFPPKVLAKFYPPSGLYPNPFWSFTNPEASEETGDPIPFGAMKGDKAKWNIKSHQDLPWAEATATSRYGIFKSDVQGEYRGLNGVNNAWMANQSLSEAKDKWYDPRKRRQKAAASGSTDPPLPPLNQGTLADAVNRMLTPGYNTCWEQFASTKWYNEGEFDENSGYMSLEYIHNNIHNLTGGTNWDHGIGHMIDVPVAAFDPIFWLHHANVDRLLCLWQCLNWDRWWDRTNSGPEHPTKFRDDKPEDPLLPFHDKDHGDPEKDSWTADKCRDWTVMNYQYDDIWDVSQRALTPDGERLDEAVFQSEMLKHINTRYPNTLSLVSSIRKTNYLDTPAGLDEPSKTWSDYIINVIYDRYALEGFSYSIEFYLSGPNGTEKNRFSRRNYIGQVYHFGGSVKETACANCKVQEDSDILSRGQVALTIHLLHRAIDADDESLSNFKDDDVEKHLKDHLHWRFVRLGGVEEPASKFPKTKVKLLRGVGRPHKPRGFKDFAADALAAFTAADFEGGEDTAEAVDGVQSLSAEAPVPVYYDYSALPDTTAGKPWGFESSSGEGEDYTRF